VFFFFLILTKGGKKSKLKRKFCPNIHNCAVLDMLSRKEKGREGNGKEGRGRKGGEAKKKTLNTYI
jgi:hypothetical protein